MKFWGNWQLECHEFNLLLIYPTDGKAFKTDYINENLPHTKEGKQQAIMQWMY